MMAQLEAPQAQQAAPQASQGAPQAQPAGAPSRQVPPEPVPDPAAECGHLGDVPLRVEAVLGRINMNMRAVASLEEGSLLTLQRAAGDNVDLWVAGVKLASGEIVVLENTVCVRITDLLSGE